MRCKKVALIASLLGGMTLSGLSNADTLSDSVTINFTGVFQDATCTIAINDNQVSNGSIDMNLGSYSPTAIKANADATTAMPLSVGFSDCGSLTQATISFSGTQTSSSLFDVQGANQNNVGVGINKSATAGDYLATGVASTVALQNGTGSIDFYARYVKIGATAVVNGVTNSVATMNIAYL